MALTKHSESSSIFLDVKHFAFWREIKEHVEGCETITVNNPKTNQKITKYGYKFHDVEGRAAKLEKYDRQHDGTRYFGFKLTLTDAGERYVIDMPYQSQILRRFLRVAPNIDWSRPLFIAAFKSKKEKTSDPDKTAIWFKQDNQTVPAYYSRETPNGMPAAKQDPHTGEWDFRAQHQWLVEKLKTETIPRIEAAAKTAAPPAGEDAGGDSGDEWDGPPSAPITDSDVPF